MGNYRRKHSRLEILDRVISTQDARISFEKYLGPPPWAIKVLRMALTMGEENGE